MSESRRTPEERILAALPHFAEDARHEACPSADVLAALLDGDLLPEERRMVRRHLARCPVCVETVGAVAAFQGPDAPAVMTPTSRRMPALPLVAAAVLLVAVGVGAWLLVGDSGSATAPTEVAAKLRRAHPELLGDLRLLDETALARSAGGERGGIRLHAPRDAILERRPRFRFQAVAGVATYTVSLRSARGNELWARETEAPPLVYPAEAPALEPGTRYLWLVTYERLGKQVERQTFHLATQADRRRFEAARARLEETAPQDLRALLEAHLALRRGYTEAALAPARAAVAARPWDALAVATLRHVRTTLGLEQEGTQQR